MFLTFYILVFEEKADLMQAFGIMRITPTFLILATKRRRSEIKRMRQEFKFLMIRFKIQISHHNMSKNLL